MDKMKKWILIGTGAVLLLVCGVFFYSLSIPPKETLSNEFKEKAVSKLLGRKAQLTATEEKKGNVSYKGRYIQFDYPAKAVIYTLKDPNFASSSSLLEDFSFDIKSPRIVLNLAVLQNNHRLASIDDNPGVKFRQTSPGQYKDVSKPIDGYMGKIYERDDENPEKTAFFLVNDHIYTISVTGNNFEDVKGVADLIFSSVKFKN